MAPPVQHNAPSPSPLSLASSRTKTGLAVPVEQLADEIVRALTADTVIAYLCDRESDRLISIAVCGRIEFGREIAFPLGSGVSGWVAVNGTPVVNADPSLDFRGIANSTRLVRSMCVPIVSSGEIVGVISAYTSDPRGFSEDDRGVLEGLVVSSEIDRTLKKLAVALKRGVETKDGHLPTVH
jgi:GAF domain-containing protein